MRPFYQSDADEDTCQCICGNKMKLYVPDENAPPPMIAGGPIPPINQLPGFCSICRVQLLPNNYAFECKAKSSKHPNAAYQICSRCARYSQKQQTRIQSSYYGAPPQYNQYGPAPPQYGYGGPPPPPSSSMVAPSLPTGPIIIDNIKYQQNEYKEITQFNRFLNTKNKKKHYEQVHQLINQASDSAIKSIFKQISNMDNKRKRHLLHTIYDHFDAENVNKYDFIGNNNDDMGDIDDVIDENDVDSMAIGPSRLNDDDDDEDEKKTSIMETIKKNIIKDNGFEANLIAGNVNIAYENDEDFMLKNAHLMEQQLNEMKRIKMQLMINDDDDDMDDMDDIPDDIHSHHHIIHGIENNEILSLSVPIQGQDIKDKNDINGDDEDDGKNRDDSIRHNIDDGNNQILSLSSPSNQITDNNPFLTDNNNNNNNQDEDDNPFNIKPSEMEQPAEQENNDNIVKNNDIEQNENNDTNVIKSESLQNNENEEEEKNEHFNIEITKPREVEINKIDIDDDDIDLSGIQFDINNNIGNQLQPTIGIMDDIADSSGNEEEHDEKLEHLHDDIKNDQHDINDIDDIDDMDLESESSNDSLFIKTGDLRMAELEELFGCTIGMNLTDSLGQDLWWYRVFIFLPSSELKNIMLTNRYFYYMKIYHELTHDHIIRISSLPALVWKLAILKDFKIEEKFKKSMKYIRLRFMKSMDWAHKLSIQYLNGLDLMRLPDTKQIYVEYLDLNSNHLDDAFLKMINILFLRLFDNFKGVNYVELINKTNPRKEFTWKLQSFNHVISSLQNVNRIRVPCWNQDLFNPKIYEWNKDMFRLNMRRNIEYIYLTEMRFENFASLLPNDNAGVDAVNYLIQLQKLKGIILRFGEDTTKKQEEMISVAESIISLLEMQDIRNTIQYIIIGVNRLQSIIYNPFTTDNDGDFEFMQQEQSEYIETLPECYELYEFNYAFKTEINKIFWNNYMNPNEKEKEQKKLDIIKQKEQKQKEMQDAIKNLIQFEIQNQNPEALQYINNEDDDDEYDNDAYLEMDINGDIINNEEVKLNENKQSDDDEEEESKDGDKDRMNEYKLEELGNALKKYKEQRQFKCAKGRSAFIVIYNTQIYVEDDNGMDGMDGMNMNKIPLNTNASGQWQCPFCTVWNRRFSRRCEVCRKRKTKYIPQEVLIQQQQFQQHQQYKDMMGQYNIDTNEIYHGWTCPMCQGKNEDTLKNCKLCTFDKPK